MDFNYSVDKVKVLIEGCDVGEIKRFGEKLHLGSVLKHNIRENYVTNSLKKCYTSFNLEHIEGNLYVGFCPNWISNPRERERCIVLEYNPNKVNPFDFDETKKVFNIRSKRIKILSIDIACDMYGVDISSIYVKKWHGNVKEISFKKSSLETLYLGELGHNHIKIYDKAKEQKVDGKWVRFEITLKNLGNYLNYDLDCFVFNLPDIYCFGDVQLDFTFDNLSDKDKYYLVNFLNYPEGIEYLNFRTKKKVLELAHKFLVPINISKNSIVQTVLDFKLF